MLLMVGGLLAQTAYIQLFDSERLIKEANNRSLRTKELQFTRGRILDRNGRFLSISVPMYSLTLDPREYFDTKLRRSNESWRALAIEMETSKGKIEANVNKFIEKKNFSKEKVDFDPRSILNTKSEGYWTQLAQVTGLDYNSLIEKVRNNPSSVFLRLDNENLVRERQKFQALSKEIGRSYNDIMDELYSKNRQRFLYLSRHQSGSDQRICKRTRY